MPRSLEDDPHPSVLRGMDGLVAALEAGYATRSLLEAPAAGERSATPPPSAEADPELELLQARARARAALFGEAAPGVRIGRYVLLHELGRGGMGIVHAAYDPELDRKIAIKLLPGSASGADPELAHRLAREAKALARLAHPNVVAVYDVGLVSPVVESDAGEPTAFVAMEYVDGPTLRGWLAEAPRSQREVLAMLEQAGRGLAAAHDVGLVHRDFKPDNVMVGTDGRARVMDFGLARLFGPRTTEPTTASEPSEPETLATRTGTILGTPAYMAPEQFDGRFDARSDQFAFCVVAWEALHGRRPFAGKDLATLAAAVCAGRIDPPGPRDLPVPEWLRAVLRRGLAVDPAERYASIHALLAALADDPSRRRRRWLAGVGMLGLAALAGGTLAWDRRERERSCEAAGAAIAEVWNDDARGAIEAAILAVDVPYAEDTRARVVDGLDGYAARWSEVRESTCRAHRVEGRHDEAMAARADACLDERRVALAAWVELLPSANADTIALIAEVTAELAAIEPCADATWLTRQPAPPDDPTVHDDVASLQRRLAQARGRAALGRNDEALAAAQAIEDEAEALAAGHLRSSAAMLVAKIAGAQGDTAEVREAHQRAIASAISASDDARAIYALTESAIDDIKRAEHGSAQTRLAIARALLARAEPEPGLSTLSVLNGEGALALARGELDEAIAAYHEALELATQLLPAGHPRISSLLNNLGASQHRHGDYAAAIATLEQVVAMREQALGADHPLVMSAYANLGSAYGSVSQLEQAEPLMLHALALAERIYGPDHETVGAHLVNLGLARLYLSRTREAVADLERAVALLERAPGDEPPELAQALSSLGMAYVSTGASDRALPVLERALALRERQLGPDHAEVAYPLDALAEALMMQGRLDESEAASRRSLEIRERALPPDHGDTGRSVGDLGIARLARGDFDGALASFHRALRIYEGRGDSLNTAVSTGHIAQALSVAGQLDEAEARYRAMLATVEQLGREDLQAQARTGLATILELRGQPADARAEFSRAHALAVRALDPESPALATSLMGLAVSEHALGDRTAALDHAEQALALYVAHAVEPWWRAEAELVLARILADDPTEATRARALRARACSTQRAAVALRLRACADAPRRGRG